MSKPPFTPLQLVELGGIDRLLDAVEDQLRERVNRLDRLLAEHDASRDAVLLEKLCDRFVGLVYLACHAAKALDQAGVKPFAPPAPARGTDTPTPGLCPSSPSLAGGDRNTIDQPSAGEASASHPAPSTSPEFSGPGGPHKSGDHA